MAESSGVSSQHEHQAQPQAEGAYGMAQQSPGPQMQHGPVYQEMSSGTWQQWVLQAPHRSDLQASWLSEVEPEAAAEVDPR